MEVAIGIIVITDIVAVDAIITVNKVISVVANINTTDTDRMAAILVVRG